MRTELEVDLAHPSGADLAATHRSVLEEVGGLQDLVDDLLLLARSDASAPIASGPIDLDELVLDEAHRLVPRPEVEVDVDDVVTVRIVGDASQVGRAVRNVLENAARHATRRVVVRLVAEGGDAVLVVEDDGTGIPPGREEEVFERFTRLDASRTAGDGGTGLGLPIAREVVTRHGGAIVVEAGASGGARFVIRLPLAATDLT
jgi:signal transduction histidine kinase